MTDALKKVFEEMSLSDSVKASITEAWEAKLSEARDELAAGLRDEFSAKYEKDKDEIVEAMDIMIRKSLEPKVKELTEQRKNYIEQTVKFKKESASKMKTFESFILKTLNKELVEFAGDRKKTNAKVSQVEKFIKEQLAKELDEFHDERKKLIEDRVQHKINSKKELAEAKKNMISKMAVICEKFIREHLTEEMSQLKNELVEAKKKHFGMKIFEAFGAEFSSSFFNERKEMNKALKVIENQSKKLKNLEVEIAKGNKRILESENKYRILQDRTARIGILNELCSTLTGSKRKLMEELLEKTATNKLAETFKNYLPSVIEDKKIVTESAIHPVLKEMTGDKKETLTSKTTKVEESSVKSEILSKFSNMNTYIADKRSVV